MYCPGKTVHILSEESVSSPSTYTATVKSFRRGIKEMGKRNFPSLGHFSEKNLCLTPGESWGPWIICEERCALAAQNMVPVLSYRETRSKTFNFFIFSPWHSLSANLGRILTLCRQTAMKPVFRWILQGDPWESGPCIITLKYLKLWLCWSTKEGQGSSPGTGTRSAKLSNL